MRIPGSIDRGGRRRNEKSRQIARYFAPFYQTPMQRQRASLDSRTGYGNPVFAAQARAALLTNASIPVRKGDEECSRRSLALVARGRSDVHAQVFHGLDGRRLL
jgi:hypothetical protein